MVQNMLVLGIESSCDETGVALVRTRAQGVPELLSHALYSQIEMHQAFGGVVPELASRDHIRRVIPLAQEVLGTAGCTLAEVDVVAYTRGPGLAGALLVGAGVACALGAALDKPVLGVHHLEGHLLSPFLSSDPPEFPFVALLVSGGHTQLMRVDGVGRYEILGETIDDAAGEAFDKSAKLMGLPYPGGPHLAKLALEGNPAAYALPRPLLHSGNLDFSFAGLKTAVLVQSQRMVAAAGVARFEDLPREAGRSGCIHAGGDCGSAVEEVAGRAQGNRPATAGGCRWRGCQPRSACPAGCCVRQTQGAGALPGVASVHRQRRDDCHGGGHAAAKWFAAGQQDVRF